MFNLVSFEIFVPTKDKSTNVGHKYYKRHEKYSRTILEIISLLYSYKYLII